MTNRGINEQLGIVCSHARMRAGDGASRNGGGHKAFNFPDTPVKRARERKFHTEHIALDLTLDPDDRRFHGTCTTTLSPILDGLKEVVLDCVDLKVKKVERVPQSGKPTTLDFEQGDRDLKITLPRAAPAGRDLTLKVRYEGRNPRRGIYFTGPDHDYRRKPRQVWTQGQDEDSRHWFPCYDYPNAKATTEVRVKVPKGWTAVSNGALVEQKSLKTGDVWHWRLDAPHVTYLVCLAAGEFTVLEDEHRDVPLTFYVHPDRVDEAARVFEPTADMMACFEERFGVEYPYPKYAQVAVEDFIFGGMENTSATILTDRVLHDERAALDYDADGLIAHELAHQWFGDLLTCREWGHAWLNEGWATYLDALYTEWAKGDDEFRWQLRADGQAYFDEDSGSYRRAIVHQRFNEPIDIFDRHLYCKGAWVAHMLRTVLGDDVFFPAIGNYVQRHRDGNVETRDLQRALEDWTGRNLEAFFEQWLHKGGHPEYKVSYEWDEDDSMARVTVRQTQDTDDLTPLFDMPVRLVFRVDGDDREVSVRVSQKEETFPVQLPAEPDMVRFDPAGDILCTLEFDKPRAMWIEQLRKDPEVIARSRAAAALGRDATEAAVGELRRALLKKSEFWGVRAACASALGQAGTDEARDVLVEALSEVDHPKARRGVARALGGFRGDEAAAKALTAHLRSREKSYFVAAECAGSLGRLRRDGDADVKTLAGVLAKRDSWNEVIRAGALGGLAEIGGSEALAAVMPWSLRGRPEPARRAAVAALGKIGRDLEGRERRQVLDRLTAILEEGDFLVTLSAIATLRTLGDLRARPDLERLRDRAEDGRIKRDCQEVLRDLGETSGAAKAVKDMQGRVDGLERENRELKDRLAKLEAKVDPKTASKNGGGRKGGR